MVNSDEDTTRKKEELKKKEEQKRKEDARAKKVAAEKALVAAKAALKDSSASASISEESAMGKRSNEKRDSKDSSSDSELDPELPCYSSSRKLKSSRKSSGGTGSSSKKKKKAEKATKIAGSRRSDKKSKKKKRKRDSSPSSSEPSESSSDEDSVSESGSSDSEASGSDSDQPLGGAALKKAKKHGSMSLSSHPEWSVMNRVDLKVDRDDRHSSLQNKDVSRGETALFHRQTLLDSNLARLAVEDCARILVRLKPKSKNKSRLKRALAFAYKSVRNLEYLQTCIEMTFKYHYSTCLKFSTEESRKYMEKADRKRLAALVKNEPPVMSARKPHTSNGGKQPKAAKAAGSKATPSGAGANTSDVVICYNCGEIGHKSPFCSKPKTK